MSESESRAGIVNTEETLSGEGHVRDLMVAFHAATVVACILLIAIQIALNGVVFPPKILAPYFGVIWGVAVLVLMRAGFIRAVRFLVVPVALAAVAISAFLARGTFSLSFLYFFPIAYLAGFILGRKATVIAIIFMILDIAFTTGIAWNQFVAASIADPRVQIYFAASVIGVFSVVVIINNVHFRYLRRLVGFAEHQSQERIAAETRSLRSEKLYKSLLEAAQDGILIMRNGVIVESNATAATQSGIHREKLLGKTMEDLSPDFQADGTRSIDRIAEIREQVSRFGFARFEWLHETPQGRAFFADVSLSAIKVDGETLTLVINRDITEKKLSERRLRESEELYRTLISKAPIAISLQRNAHVIYHNSSYATMYGYPPDADLKNFDVMLVTPPERREETLESIRKRESGESGDTVLNAIGVDRHGVRFPARVFGVRVELGGGPASVVFVIDMRENEAAMDALRKSQADLSAILESTDDLIWSVDAADFRILTMNRAFRNYILNTYKIDVKAGTRITHLLPAPFGDSWENRYHKALESGAFKDEYKSVGGYDLEVTVRPIYDGTDVRAISVFTKDITQTKRAQESERLMRERMFQAEKLSSLGLLVAGIAHEINNPNQYIYSNLGTIKSAWESAVPILDEYRQENGSFSLGGIPYDQVRGHLGTLLAAVEDGSRRIHSIISELKSFASTSPGTDLQDIELNRAVSSAIELSRGMIKKATGTFVVRLGENIPLVRAQRQRVEQVTINLIQNACYALEDSRNGIEIETGLTDDGCPYIAVIDEGKGMSPEELSRIQTPFYTTRRESGGTGLGLFVSANIIRSFGGEIRFSSEIGKGTRALVVFPSPETKMIGSAS